MQLVVTGSLNEIEELFAKLNALPKDIEWPENAEITDGAHLRMYGTCHIQKCKCGNYIRIDESE